MDKKVSRYSDYSKKVDKEIESVRLGMDSNQYYHDNFDEKIKVWQKNGIK